MVKKHLSHIVFREAHTKKTKFGLTVGYLLKSIDSTGKRPLIMDMVVVYYGSVLVDYEVNLELEGGWITFEGSVEAS
jgi:hypothetical protein